MRKVRGRMTVEEALERLEGQLEEMSPRMRNQIFIAGKLLADGDVPSAWRMIRRIEAELTHQRQARELVTA